MRSPHTKAANTQRHRLHSIRRTSTIRRLSDHRIFSNGATTKRQSHPHRWPIASRCWNRTCISRAVYPVTDPRNHINRRDRWNVNGVGHDAIAFTQLSCPIRSTDFVLSDGHGSRSGSQQGSRDNSAARNSYSSSRSLQQMRPSQMQFNTLPLSSSSMQKGGLRGDNKVHSTVAGSAELG